MGAHDATVFVVDDDSSVRDSLTRLLRSAGWQVQAYASAQAFLDQASARDTGCVVLDVRMSGLSGLDAHAQMAARQIRLPVVFLTGYADLPVAVKAMKHGAVDFLQKPVNDDLLLETIDGALRQDRDTRSRSEAVQITLERLATLTAREQDVLKELLRGRLNKQIADVLGISIKTVKVHRGRIMHKMSVRSIAQLVHACDAVDMAKVA